MSKTADYSSLTERLMYYFAQAISVIFHPVFLILYFLLITLIINPYLFALQDPKDLGVVIIYVTILSIVFPLIPIVMMYMLGFTKSIELHDRKERTIPLVITGIFYLWLYINLLNNNSIPNAFTFFLLGSAITLFSCFFINLFSKISLHTAGIGGLLAGVIILRYHFAYTYFGFSFGQGYNYQLNSNLLIVIFLIIAGLVGTSRMYLKSHNAQEIYGGYMVGILSQIIAMRFLIY